MDDLQILDQYLEVDLFFLNTADCSGICLTYIKQCQNHTVFLTWSVIIVLICEGFPHNLSQVYGMGWQASCGGDFLVYFINFRWTNKLSKLLSLLEFAFVL